MTGESVWLPITLSEHSTWSSHSRTMALRAQSKRASQAVASDMMNLDSEPRQEPDMPDGISAPTSSERSRWDREDRFRNCNPRAQHPLSLRVNGLEHEQIGSTKPNPTTERKKNKNGMIADRDKQQATLKHQFTSLTGAQQKGNRHTSEHRQP